MSERCARPGPVIEIENLSFAYNSVPVLAGVSLRVLEGDFLSIVGPNGGGKTTLLKLVLGLIVPQEGTVRVFGGAPAQARNRIGSMPQSPQLDLRFPVDVSDVVAMGLLGSGRRTGLPFRSAAENKQIQRALGKLDIANLAGRPFVELSGGQRQRALIARAIVSDPELLILDEPTSHVDLTHEQELFDVLSDLNHSMTIVVVSHDVGFVSTYVKTVACVNCRVVVHPTHEITGEIISEIYGADVRMVRHDEIGRGGCG